ncbi:MAG: PEGA domain-containing protein [Myxococcaceae bacterium]
MRFAAILLLVTGCAGPGGLAGAGKGAGDLRLTCEPRDAEVYLDGVAQGTCLDFSGAPRGLAVGAGLHRVDVKKRGYSPYQTYYQPSGATASLAPTLVPLSGSQGESR